MKPKILLDLPMIENYYQGVSCEGGGDCGGDCAGDCGGPGCDGDGACSRSINSFSTENVITNYSLEGKVLRQTANQWYHATVDNDHHAILSTQAQVPLFVLNHPAKEILDFFSEPHISTEWLQTSSIDYQDAQLAIAQFCDLGLLQEVSARSEITTSNHTASPLEAWLYLTRACNLVCAHCFVSKDVRRMTLETGLQAVARLFVLAEKYGHPQVKIKYAGGEPTMNWDLIPALHERAKSLASDTGLKLTEILITNATLLNHERLQFIKDERFHLSISMDGFGEGHDRQRPVLNGNPTFERVLRSVCLAVEMGLSPYLIMTITRLNQKEVPALVAFALQHHLLLNLNFYRPHSLNDFLVPDNNELTSVLQEALRVIEANLPDYDFMQGLIDRSNFGTAHHHACGAGRNYLSIDTDGSVLPCHMLTGSNILGVPLQLLESPRFDDFPNPKVDQRNGCNTCEWRYWCAGGCPVHAMNIKGTSNVSSPYCSVYKAVYPELIRLKALQLIQAGRDNK